ncbi:MAG: PKD domain-containing protein [Bacteroidales bacterium]|nr:PKD domain-containing protein [Bacteroidales bacterium]
MYKILLLLTIVLFATPLRMPGQSRYEVTKAGFSTQKYDEFCPVLYKGDIVFCSNQEDEFLITYQNRRRRGLFNIFKVEIVETNEYTSPEIFSRNLHTSFNDGPVAFSPDENMAVYSRNINADARARNVVDLNNNLGLYFTEFSDGEWANSTAFKHNNINYSITTPCFSPDGQYLYYGSNMPGGYGGTDIYRSRLVDGEWSEPENVGKNINTPGNEVYPFIPRNGELFFASDGHGGLGKKDIFLSGHAESGWIKPVHLEAPINSKDDDFGLFTGEDFSMGYFSSNRDASDDIYSFSTLVPQLFNCDTLIENQYCFEFRDDQDPGFDTIPVSYVWEFSDGSKIEGLRVEHCLPGAGKYWAKLTSFDNTTDKTFQTQSTMEFELVDHIQPYITSSDTMIEYTDILFSGLESNLPDYTIEKYVWDFGDGGFMTGPEVVHRYKRTGIFYVKLGLIGYAEGATEKEMKCVIKPVIVVAGNQQKPD